VRDFARKIRDDYVQASYVLKKGCAGLAEKFSPEFLAVFRTFSVFLRILLFIFIYIRRVTAVFMMNVTLCFLGIISQSIYAMSLT
jgi:hypothetical protein